MKSGISYFNGAVFRKDVTRFAPSWILYSILTLILLLTFIQEQLGVRFAATLAETTPVMGFSALCYAFLNVQLLFGDLFNSRMSNALHAMPIRRETWFGTHILSGLAFALVPQAAFTGIFLLLCGNVWQVPLLWFAVSALQYLFFFGIGVLSALCVGNRFAMALVYGILNLFSLILYWLISKIYQPLMHGILISDEIFSLFCPMAHLIGDPYFDVRYDILPNDDAVLTALRIESGWIYLATAAVVGVGALVLSLVLYRRRNLECAGDFVAIRWMGPVFLVLYTFCAGVCCHGFFSLFTGVEISGFLILGLAVGFFTGLMLLERTVRVLRKRNVLLFFGLLAVFVVTLVLTVVDPLGITRWVPEASHVQSVRVASGDSRYTLSEAGILESPEDIDRIIDIHEDCVKKPDLTGRCLRLTLEYTLKSGISVQRQYEVPVAGGSGKTLEELFSRPGVVLGELYTEPHKNELVRAEFSSTGLYWETEAELQGLMDAIILDCQAGVMAQDWAYMDDREFVEWISLEARNSNGIYYHCDFRFHEGCTHIIAWLEAQAGTDIRDLLAKWYG